MEIFPGNRSSHERASRRAAPWAEILEVRTLMANGIAPSGGSPILTSPNVALTNVTVASFTVTDTTGSPGSKWRALISWGDGDQDKLVIPIQVGSTFEFHGTHTYMSAGNFTINVMIAVPNSHLPSANT